MDPRILPTEDAEYGFRSTLQRSLTAPTFWLYEMLADKRAQINSGAEVIHVTAVRINSHNVSR